MKDVAACDKLRGGGKQPLIRRCPNGETFVDELNKLTSEYIGCDRERGEVKHLSSHRKRNKVTADFLSHLIRKGHVEIKSLHDSLSSGERNGTSQNRYH